MLIVEFNTGRARLCRWSGLVVSFVNPTTRTRPDTTRHVCTGDQVSDKVCSVSNSTIHGPTDCVYDPKRLDPRTKCLRVEIERTSLRTDKVGGLVADPSGPWIWSGWVCPVKFRNDTTIPSWQNSAGRRRLTGGNIGSGMPPAGRRWAA